MVWSWWTGDDADILSHMFVTKTHENTIRWGCWWFQEVGPRMMMYSVFSRFAYIVLHYIQCIITCDGIDNIRGIDNISNINMEGSRCPCHISSASGTFFSIGRLYDCWVLWVLRHSCFMGTMPNSCREWTRHAGPYRIFGMNQDWSAVNPILWISASIEWVCWVSTVWVSLNRSRIQCYHRGPIQIIQHKLTETQISWGRPKLPRFRHTMFFLFLPRTQICCWNFAVPCAPCMK